MLMLSFYNIVLLWCFHTSNLVYNIFRSKKIFQDKPNNVISVNSFSLCLKMIFNVRNKIYNISSNFRLVMHRKNLRVTGKIINNIEKISIIMHRNNKTWPHISICIISKIWEVWELLKEKISFFCLARWKTSQI